MSPWLQICRLSGSKIQIAFLGETKRDHSSEPTCLWQSVARRSCPGCRLRHRRRLVLDETEHGAMLVQVGPPASSKTATPNHPAIEMNSSSVTVRRRGVGLRCRPIGQQRSCLRRSVESADIVPAIVTEPVSNLGDVWVLDRHRVLCGNALDPSAFTLLMGEERAAMVFTDPPYNVPIEG